MTPLLLVGFEHRHVPRTTFAEALELFEATADGFLAARTGSHGWLVLAGQLAGTANCLLQRTLAERMRGSTLDDLVAKIDDLVSILEVGGDAIADHRKQLTTVGTRLRELCET